MINQTLIESPEIMHAANSEEIDKTVVITYDDATRMIDFCKNSDGSLSKNFYDWYLDKKPIYFATTGMLVIDGIIGENEKAAVSFDFSNPNSVEFNVYRYKDQSIITRFFFNREENLTFSDIKVATIHFSKHLFKGQRLWLSPENIDEVAEIANKIALCEVDNVKKGLKAKTKKSIVEAGIDAAYKHINLFQSKQFVYFTYALMYYIANREPEEITSSFQEQLENDTEGVKVKSIYKYSGYIDLRKNRVYKPVIEKNPDEPIREYQRHVQKWTVRGHYRKTKNGLIWIEPHTKGIGELEKRIYGTKDEELLNIRPKVFEVERTVKENYHTKKITDSVVLSAEPNKDNCIIKTEPEKRFRLIRSVLKFFGFFK